MESEFEVLDLAIFQDLSSILHDSPSDNSRLNYCDDCNIATNFDASQSVWSCSQCGMVQSQIGNTQDCFEDSTGTLKVGIGNRRRNYYNVTQDYSKIQKTAIAAQLSTNNDQYSGPKIPKNILAEVAEEYNKIQKITVNETDLHGNITGNKKFVKRGHIKDEMLGALIYYMCIKAGITRKRRDVAAFMKLPNKSISRGECELRELHANGKIKIPVNVEPNEDFVDRYLEALGLDSDGTVHERYREFILELVEESVKKCVGVGSLSSSKIVGAMWIVITALDLGIDSAKLEQSCDKIRKNTWMRFVNDVELNKVKFAHIYTRYNIPHGIKGNVIRRKKTPVVKLAYVYPPIDYVFDSTTCAGDTGITIDDTVKPVDDTVNEVNNKTQIAN